MSVNGVTSTTNAAYSAYAATAQTSTKKADQAEKKTTGETTTTETTKSSAKKSDGVVYESTAYKKKVNKEIVNIMKTDLNAHTTQLQNIVEQLISKQGATYGKANDMWKFLAGGDFTVDAATKEQAQKDIANDGYWGVEATSDRILDFAKALSNDDPKMMEKMKKAFQKGFEQATRTWGKNLPDISQKTYDAVMKKFDEWTASTEKTSEEVTKTTESEV